MQALKRLIPTAPSLRAQLLFFGALMALLLVGSFAAAASYAPYGGNGGFRDSFGASRYDEQRPDFNTGGYHRSHRPVMRQHDARDWDDRPDYRSHRDDAFFRFDSDSMQPFEPRTYQPSTPRGMFDLNFNSGLPNRAPGRQFDRGPLLPDRQPALPQPMPWQTPPSQSVPAASSADLVDVQALITTRYQNSAVRKLLGSLSPQGGVAVYAEVLDKIVTRHLEPQPPQALARRGLYDLSQALQNPAFLQANGLSRQMPQLAQFQQWLEMTAQRASVQSSSDAVALVAQVMQTAQQAGIHPACVAVEFIYGAMESLDKFSAFVPEDTARNMSHQLGASLVGIGVEIEAAPQGAMIKKVLPDGPAAQAGLRKGDLIVAVDNQPLSGRSIDDAVSLITGSAGSPVALAVARGTQPPLRVSLARRSVQVRSVTDVQMLDPAAGIAYLKLDVFASTSAKEMEAALLQLHQQRMQSLILDLRGDPGGLLTASIEVAKLFLPSGTIVSTRGRTASDNTQELAVSNGRTWKTPLIVLIDEQSASASEILAAAIQENGRGILVGRHSYGKGTVQSLFNLDSTAATLRLTTARFYSPRGRMMAGAGVEPDVPVPAGSSAEVDAANGDLRADRDVQIAVQIARQQRAAPFAGARPAFPIPGT